MHHSSRITWRWVKMLGSCCFPYLLKPNLCCHVKSNEMYFCYFQFCEQKTKQLLFAKCFLDTYTHTHTLWPVLVKGEFHFTCVNFPDMLNLKCRTIHMNGSRAKAANMTEIICIVMQTIKVVITKTCVHGRENIFFLCVLCVRCGCVHRKQQTTWLVCS